MPELPVKRRCSAALPLLCVRSGFWAAAVEPAERPPDLDTSGWDAVWGDRCTELVWTGVGMKVCSGAPTPTVVRVRDSGQVVMGWETSVSVNAVASCLLACRWLN